MDNYPPPNPNLPWYQFSLRSLLLLTLYVAVLCSLGICTHWIFSVVIGIGGIAGWIVARTWFGFLLGAMWALAFVLLIPALALNIPMALEDWQQYAILVIAAIVGGVLGGFRAGKRKWFDRDPRP